MLFFVMFRLRLVMFWCGSFSVCVVGIVIRLMLLLLRLLMICSSCR